MKGKEKQLREKLESDKESPHYQEAEMEINRKKKPLGIARNFHSPSGNGGAGWGRVGCVCVCTFGGRCSDPNNKLREREGGKQSTQLLHEGESRCHLLETLSS